MPFSKSFPKTTDKTIYPKWEEVYLTEEEEKAIEESAKEESRHLMEECIKDAKKIFLKQNLKDFQSDIIHAAIALFEKRASHVVFWKETKCKEKFDQSHKTS